MGMKHQWHHCPSGSELTTFVVCIWRILNEECKGCIDLMVILQDKIEAEEDKELIKNLKIVLRKVNKEKRVRGYNKAIKYLAEHYREEQYGKQTSTSKTM